MDIEMLARLTYEHINGGEWTTEPPTEPGWYWARHANQKRLPGAIVVEIGAGLDGGLYAYPAGEGHHGWDMQMFTHWLGPLPVPAPPVATDKAIEIVKDGDYLFDGHTFTPVDVDGKQS